MRNIVWFWPSFISMPPDPLQFISESQNICRIFWMSKMWKQRRNMACALTEVYFAVIVQGSLCVHWFNLAHSYSSLLCPCWYSVELFHQFNWLLSYLCLETSQIIRYILRNCVLNTQERFTKIIIFKKSLLLKWVSLTISLAFSSLLDFVSFAAESLQKVYSDSVSYKI
jgi:hypothetical protein